MVALHPVGRSRTVIFGLYAMYEGCPFFWQLFQFLNIWWSWIKPSFLKVPLSHLLILLFLIRFLIKKYKYVACILNQLELKPNIIVTLHNFQSLSYQVENWDVLNDLQDQVTTKPKLSLFCYFQTLTSN